MKYRVAEIGCAVQQEVRGVQQEGEAEFSVVLNVQ